MEFLLCFILLLSTVNAQNCLQANGDSTNLPTVEDIGRNVPRIPRSNQAIVASYQFQCCGNITEWEAAVEPGGGMHNKGQYNITFQVWRPSPTVQTDGCYSLVGQNRFTSVTFSEHVIRETPPPEQRIPFRPDDVVGFFIESARGENDGVTLTTEADFNSQEVWYGSVVDAIAGPQNCPFPVGTQSNRFLRSSTNVAPLVSASLSTGSCPPLIVPTTSTPRQPSPSSTMVQTPAPSITPTPTPPPPPTQPPTTMATTTEGMPPTDAAPPATGPDGETTASEPPQSSDAISDGTTQTAGETTSEIRQPTGNNNSGAIIGVVVALILLVAIIVLAIVFVVCFLRTRVVKKTLSHPDSPTGVANPNYETDVFLKKSVQYKADNGGTVGIINGTEHAAMYESLDVDYNGMAHDYTYPAPSPTATDAMYTYIPHNEVKSSNGHAGTPKKTAGGMYHAKGPDVANNVYDEMQYADPDVKFAGERKRRSPKHQYQTLDVGPTFGETGESSLVLYEDPTVSKYREDNGFFDSVGIYVPTEEQRVGLANHYELSDNVPQTYHKLKFFVEDQVYWAPATTTSGLYEQLAAKKYREIPRNQLNILEELGSGQFGQVCKGMWTVSGATLGLAAKTLKPQAPEEDKIKFLQEAAIMGQFTHPNVVKLYGVVTVGEPVMICLELMTNGDLRSYLRSIDTKNSQQRNELQQLFLRFAKEIAAGMDYLSRKSFVHRDLAARNVLLDESLTCKIGDFGMARDLMDDTYYRSKGGKIPVKWTAPEALLYKKYSTDSDVWSYGMVLFEIWSVGRKPFSLHTNGQVLKLVRTGHCQPPPPGCPRAIYQLMVNCWNPEHQERPKFGEVFAYLHKPASKLIYWSELDSSSTPQSEVLGEELEYGLKLYIDLQEKYKEIYESI